MRFAVERKSARRPPCEFRIERQILHCRRVRRIIPYIAHIRVFVLHPVVSGKTGDPQQGVLVMRITHIQIIGKTSAARCALDTGRHTVFFRIGQKRCHIGIRIQAAQRPHVIPPDPAAQFGIEHEPAVNRIVGNRCRRQKPIGRLGFRGEKQFPRFRKAVACKLVILQAVTHIVQTCRPAEFLRTIRIMQTGRQLGGSVIVEVAPCTVEIGLQLQSMTSERLPKPDTPAA